MCAIGTNNRPDHRPLFLAAVVNLSLFLNSLDQIGHSEPIFPAIQKDDVRFFILIEQTQHHTRRRIGIGGLFVASLLGKRRIQAHHDVFNHRKWLIRGPEVDPTALDDALLFGVEHFGVNFLSSKRRSLELQ